MGTPIMGARQYKHLLVDGFSHKTQHDQKLAIQYTSKLS